MAFCEDYFALFPKLAYFLLADFCVTNFLSIRWYRKKPEHVRDYARYDALYPQPETVWATDWLWHSSVECCPSQHHHQCVISITASKQLTAIRYNGPNYHTPPQKAAGTSKTCQNGYWQTDNRNQRKQCNRQEIPVLTTHINCHVSTAPSWHDPLSIKGHRLETEEWTWEILTYFAYVQYIR
jgi:hypothetical protein